jgi:predicted nuclease of predicted toxin-antitoxin system
MIYCKECVNVSHCRDIKKNQKDSIVCHKYKDANYKVFSRDSDCDSICIGLFFGDLSGLNRKARDTELVANG